MRPVVVIMAGGSGKRFWPLSRENRAKQSLALFSEKTLLAETIERVLPLSPDILVVASEKQRTPIESDVHRYPGTRTLFEPIGRNTAPCIALALRAIRKWRGAESFRVAVLPADHYIARPDLFRQSLTKGISLLHSLDGIGTIGIRPYRPETGYGYINIGPEIAPGVHSVKRFEEKPDRARAERFLISGDYLWNGGIFLFRLERMEQEIAEHASDIAAAIQALPDPERVSAEEYARIRSISIDYAVMEKTSAPLFSVVGDFGWSDIGSWATYHELLPQDSEGNAARGPAHFIESRGNLVINLTSRPIFVFRKNGQFIVATEDAILAADLADHQEIRRITEWLEQKGFTHLL